MSDFLPPGWAALLSGLAPSLNLAPCIYYPAPKFDYEPPSIPVAVELPPATAAPVYAPPPLLYIPGKFVAKFLNSYFTFIPVFALVSINSLS